jgi:hypothetical protein
MTYICAIAVYTNDELADITLYREWESKDLFVEASAMMALFSGCETRKEYLEKRYTFKERIRRNPDHEKEVMRWCLEAADDILALNLKRMSLYHVNGGLCEEGTGLLHEPCEPYSVLQFFALLRHSGLYGQAGMNDAYRRACLVRDHHYLENLDTILAYYRVSFESVDCEAVRNLFLDDSRLMGRLSGKLRSCYRRSCRMKRNCVN